MLPTELQFWTAKGFLSEACDCASFMRHVKGKTHDEFKIDCIRNLKRAAECLGLELIERRPFAETSTIPSSETIEISLSVTPAARDGGRMDMEADADA